MWQQLSRSELLSTFFPTWLWQGRQWSKWRIPKYDPYYWINQHAHPVTSTYYPVGILLSYLASWSKDLDVSFRIFSYSLMLHFVGAFFGWFLLCSWFFKPEVALFGALTFTFQGAHLRQQPCIIYTISWFPWMLYGLVTNNVLLSSISIGMIVLSGYYPLAVFLLPVSTIFGQWLPIGIGLLIGLPQLIPFLKYLPKTIRGSVEAPSNSPIENKFYFGIIPIVLLVASFKLYYLLLSLPILFRLFKSTLLRVPQRAMILSCYGAIWLSLLAMNNLSPIAVACLTIIQAFDLWIHNRELIPPRPFCELWQKPSRAFNTKLTRFLEANLGDARVAGLPYPLFTGHINGFKTIGYCGSMQNKLMWKWRKSFNHDPFIDGVDESDLTRFDVKYAYSRKKLDWASTGIKNLYLNPAYSG